MSASPLRRFGKHLFTFIIRLLSAAIIAIIAEICQLHNVQKWIVMLLNIWAVIVALCMIYSFIMMLYALLLLIWQLLKKDSELPPTPPR